MSAPAAQPPIQAFDQLAAGAKNAAYCPSLKKTRPVAQIGENSAIGTNAIATTTPTSDGTRRDVLPRGVWVANLGTEHGCQQAED